MIGVFILIRGVFGTIIVTPGDCTTCLLRKRTARQEFISSRIKNLVEGKDYNCKVITVAIFVGKVSTKTAKLA